MEFNKSQGGGGAWLDKAALRNGDIAKIITEALPVESQHGTQIVAKVKIKGGDPEPKNFAFNPATKNALIDAFGKDSKLWCNNLLTVYTEAVRTAGKKGIAAYLIPDGFDHWDDDAGYLVIGRAEQKPEPIAAAKPEITSGDIPF